ncbi:MAG: hypothetical protein RIM80_03010, partial [Alphaproteobacteria bacterium]
ELALALYGVSRLVKLDRAAVQYFDNTPEAFWRSFNAAVIAAPAYALLVLLNFPDPAPAASELRVLFVETTAYVIGWVRFPLVMVSFTDAVGCGRHYYRFIAAWNWSVVLQVFVFLGVTAFAASGALPASLAGLLSLIATFAILFFQGFVAHVMLDVRRGIAALIVGIDLTIGIGLSVVSRGFYL